MASENENKEADVPMDDVKPPPRKKLKIWKAKWQKEEWPVYFDDSTTIGDIKDQLEAQTDVRPCKQKLVGFKVASKYKNEVEHITDDTRVTHLRCSSKKKFIMIGTLDEHAFNDDDIATADVPFVIDDEDWEYSEDPDEIVRRHKEHRDKLRKCIEKTQINVMYAPRKGKKLLVLDIDYTLFDMGSKHEQDWNKLKRPYADFLLEQCYPHYDIVIWSQTSWKWIEIKLTEMNMLMNAKYNISFVLDREAMFTVVTSYAPSARSKKEKGQSRKHWVKPLELIWSKYPGIYSEENTVHIDDLARNFAMNPTCGLRCTAYRNARRNKATDTELLYITQYLLLIAKKDNFRGLKHHDWKTYLSKHSNVQLG